MNWVYVLQLSFITLIGILVLIAIFLLGIVLINWLYKKHKRRKYNELSETIQFKPINQPTLQDILSDKSIKRLPAAELQLFEIVGKGAYGVVRRAIWTHISS